MAEVRDKINKKSKNTFILTAEEIQELASEFGFETRAVAMKNTHHAEMNELLVGKHLSWCR